jgi:release factor glutamine methyltransferase
MTIAEAGKFITEQLKKNYEAGESASISDLVLEHLTGKNRSERSSGIQSSLSAEQNDKLENILTRLLKHEPVQYILNESWFGGLKFFVNKNVLIPRQETEELVEWIIDNCKFPVKELSILDIGSGSGCIPIALKRRIRKADVWSCDISYDALKVAKQNAETLGAEVNFIQLDFLDKNSWKQFPPFDIIVSNPPYVPEQNKESMKPNVLQYEPSIALFVPDIDPLVFYKAVAEFGKTHLNKDGTIYCEIHEDLEENVLKLFNDLGYKTELKKDMQQKDRMIKAKPVRSLGFLVSG